MDTRSLLDILYSRLNIAEALKDLQPKKMINYHLLACPQCGKKNNYLYNNRSRFTCNWLGSCRYSMDIWSHIQKTKKLSDIETLKELSRLANYQIPDLDEGLADRVARVHEEIDALGCALHHFKEVLWEERGKKTLEHLKRKGFAEGEIILMELGYFTTPGEVEKLLINKGFSPTIIRNLGLSGEGMGYTHKLVIPFRDAAGLLKGFIVETTEQAECYYLYTHSKDRTSLFNLNESRNEKDLILVESYMDALGLTVRGMKGVVATGGPMVHDHQAQEAAKLGARNLILVFNNTAHGMKGVELSMKYLNIVGLKTFVGTLVEGYTSPGEVMNGNKARNLDPLGMQGLRELMRKPRRACEWMAERIISRHDLANPIEWEKAKNEAFNYVETISDPIETEIFFSTMAAAMEISDEFFEKGLKHYREAQENYRIQQSLKIFLDKFSSTLSVGQQLFEGGKYLELKEHLEKELRILNVDFERVRARRAKDLGEYLRDKYEALNSRKEELLGFQLNRFKELSQRIDGLQPGLYILAAESFAGKTAFLTNMFMDCLQSDMDMKGLYLSLDDDRDSIIHRLACILTGLDLNTIQRSHENEEIQKKIKKAYDQLIDLAESGRLEVRDLAEIFDVDAVEAEIRKRATRKLIVVIDGMFNVEESQGAGAGPGNLEISKRLKTLVDSLRIPIIFSEELGKYPADMPNDMQSTARELIDIGKYDYHAGVVWLLYPENRKTYLQEDSPYLILDYAKNKLSPFKGYQRLRFHKSQGRIDEVEES